MDEVTFGRSVRALRIRKRLTQEELGNRAGVSRGVIARIEQGRAARVTVATLERVASALGARVLVKLLWQGEGLDRLLDGRHAVTVEEVVRFLRAAGWQVATEVSFNEYGERGSIDVLAFHRSARSLLVVEVKTTIADAQELQSTLDRKVRLAPRIVRDRGWSVGSVAKLLVIVDTRANRLQIDRLAMTFATSFPSRTWAVRRWLASPTAVEPLCGIWFLRIGTEAVVSQRVRTRRTASTHEGEARI
jgi:transcriptional regulator with XRE-family HTH domain